MLCLIALIPEQWGVICLAICTIYRRNFALVFGTMGRIIQKGWIEGKENRKDNEELKSAVIPSFRKMFRVDTDFSKMSNVPSILVINYACDRLENLASLLLPGDFAIMMRDGLVPVLGKVVKWSVVTKAKNSYDETKEGIRKHISAGRSVMTYATKHRKLAVDYVNKVRSGVFKIAQELDVPITLVVFDYIATDGICSIVDQNYKVRTSHTFFVTDVKESVYFARKYFQETLREFKRTKFIF